MALHEVSALRNHRLLTNSIRHQAAKAATLWLICKNSALKLLVKSFSSPFTTSRTLSLPKNS